MSVSLINGHIDNTERCVCCGREIPEGRQVCVICGYTAEKKKADLVEVVRCCECKYYVAIMFEGKPMHYGHCLNQHDVSQNPKNRFMLDFCSYGVRKGEE